MTFDPRWKNPQGSDAQNMYLWAQDLIKELRKGDYISVQEINSSQIVGTDTTDDAAAGRLGEFVSSSVVLSSAVALTSDAGNSIANITLTAGDWDLRAVANFSTANTTSVTRAGAALTTTANTIPSPPDPGSYVQHRTAADAGGLSSISLRAMTIPSYRFSLAAPGTIYLTVVASFTVSTCDAWGIISARRVR